MKLWFRNEILKLKAYTPGEQPKVRNVIKLNTNENPFPPSPRVKKFLSKFDINWLKLYPDPESSALRELISSKFAVKPENIIIGNGSDDILNILSRCCVDKKRSMAYFEPSYSLYPVLAEMQGAKSIKIPLDGNFNIPQKIPSEAFKAGLFMITRPNAPTGNNFPTEIMRDICKKSRGIVLIDEAYADFANDNCISLLKEFDNLVICRTLSKSYSLAGIRLGFAIASETIIEQMMKVKDSYNVSRLTQEIAKIAILDEKYFRKNINSIIKNRDYLTEELKKMGFFVVDSQANFIFAKPPAEFKLSAKEIYQRLKEQNIFIRYFNTPRTKDFIRITIGTKKELDFLISAIKELKK